MGTYRESEFYDEEAWIGDVYYSPPWSRPPKWYRGRNPRRHIMVYAWVIRFKTIAKRLSPDEEIFDLGCGGGLFAAFIWHSIKHRARYVGIDFSEGRIKEAIEANKREAHQNAEFYRRRAENLPELIHEYWGDKPLPTFVCAEMLEHVQDDLSIVDSIPSGMKCVITVPHFDAPAHVRWFPTSQDVVDRYGKYFVEPLQVETFYTAGTKKKPQYDHIFAATKK